MSTAFDRELRQIKEKVETLTGERGAAGKPERAVRLKELGERGGSGGSGGGQVITKISQLENDKGYVTSAGAAAAAPVQSVNGRTGEVVLNAADVGADASGAATTAVAAHVSETDPHPQYAPLLRPKFTDWIGVGVTPDRPVTISTATNTLPPGSASFLIYGDNNKERLEMRAASGSDPTFQAKNAGGTIASPSATPNGRRLCQIGGTGHDGVDWVIPNRAIIRLYATEAWTPTANGAAIAAVTTSNGSTLVTERWKWEHDGNYMPCLDNTYTLGSGPLRIKEVFAANGTINTSDAREKAHVRPLTNAELEASIEIGGRIGAYRWLNMVETKGDAARQHIGLTVQEAIAVLESHGLDPFAYGFICYDSWDESPEIRNEWAALPQVVDDFGNVVQEARNAGFEVVQEYRPAGDRYSFRMDELLAFLVRGLAHRLDAVEQRLSVAGL